MAPNSHQSIYEYIILCRGKGLHLSYQEYQIVDTWISICSENLELLLITLDEILPDFYSRSAEKKIKYPSLTTVDQSVTKRLVALQ